MTKKPSYYSRCFTNKKLSAIKEKAIRAEVSKGTKADKKLLSYLIVDVKENDWKVDTDTLKEAAYIIK